MTTVKTITIIGAGNVATHLGKALLKKGFIINQVYSHTIDNAYTLASELNAMPCDDVKFITDESDLYIISIKDDFIEEIVSQIPFTKKTVVHTSGSISMDVLSKFEHHGIFYPLQTLSKDASVNITEVPLCIEANNNNTEETLIELGKLLSKNVQLINSEQRKKIHLAAVFACNFSNHMYAIAEELLKEDNIDLDILKPLIIETANKIQHNSPSAMQTGPAKRNDEAVIKKHIEMLANATNHQDIYKIITENIINQ